MRVAQQAQRSPPALDEKQQYWLRSNALVRPD